MYMAQMVRGIELCRRFGMTPEFIEREVEKPIDGLSDIADRLKDEPQPFMRASGFAIIAFIGLSWPERARNTPEVLAKDLRNALERSLIRLCSTVELLIWKLLTGGVAAGQGSEDREWFVQRLAAIIRTMPPTSWTDILTFLKCSFMPDGILLEKMKEVWHETETQNVNEKGRTRKSLIQGTAIAGS